MSRFPTISSLFSGRNLGIKVCILITILAFANSQTPSPFVLTNEPGNDTVELVVGKTVTVNFTIVSIDVTGTFTISVTPENTPEFSLDYEPLEGIEGDADTYDQTLIISITGKKISISNISLIATDEDGTKTKILEHYIKVLRDESLAARIVRYLVLLTIVVVIFLIGITTEIKVILSILRRPFGVVIGMLCQFIIMPFVAWSLSKIFSIDGPASLGLILDGSCPGGTLSNMLSVLLDVNYVLSITMTFFSSIIALFMMPFNLFLYGRSLVAAGETIKTPFLEIFLQLLLLAVPLGIGMFLGHKWPKTKDFALKYIKPCCGIIILILICSDLPFNLFIFDSPLGYYVIAIIFPLIGALAGFFIAKVVQMSTQSALTVALETGIQNALLAITVLYFFYPQPEADLATRLPYLILIFTAIEGAIGTLIYILLKKYYWHGCPFDTDEPDAPPAEDEKKDGDAEAPEVKTRVDEKKSDMNGNISTVSGSFNAKYEVGCQADFGDETLAEINLAFEAKD